MSAAGTAVNIDDMVGEIVETCYKCERGLSPHEPFSEDEQYSEMAMRSCLPYTMFSATAILLGAHLNLRRRTRTTNVR